MVHNKINRFKLYNTYLLKWDVIHKLYDSFIGKIFTLLSILSIILSNSIISNMNSKSLLFLSVAVLVFILGYIIYMIFIPATINDFKRYEFIEYLVTRNEKEQLSVITEFSFLEKEDLSELPLYIDSFDNFSEIKKIDIFKDISKDYLYQLAQIKYDYINNSILWIRFFITLLLIIFFIMFYYVTIERIINYIF